MANSSSVLDKWREYFRSANSDIFSIIEHAIMVAASDCPYDFRLNRDRIAEMLFTCKITKCFGCDQVKLSLPNVNGSERSDDKCKSGIEAGRSRDTKESKIDSNLDDGCREIREMNITQVSNCSYGDAEALTDEIEEESQLIEDVLRIKEILDNSEEECDVLLFDSLRRHELTILSVEILKATDIGKSVIALRKHRSKDIRSLARTLIENWTSMVDEWVKATEDVTGTEVASESVKTSVIEEEEEGLPSPPLDEGAFFATPTSMELSQFFDGMDDDGNPRNGGEFNKNRGNGRRSRLENHTDSSIPPKNRNAECPRTQEPALIKQAPPCHPNKLLIAESGQGREKPAVQPKTYNEIKVQHKPDKGGIQKKRVTPQREKFCGNEASVRTKLETAKRKLQERYQEAENAKKQRTIQVMELHELPKQNPSQRNQNMKPGNHNRHWANVRR